MVCPTLLTQNAFPMAKNFSPLYACYSSASALLNSAQQIGVALGLAMLGSGRIHCDTP
ncbi:hypothetical protein RERY_23960 [Rhodococcus erythropolis]|nr:hypothetical protein RERY_23960 [Rhodococcus erythropolis]